VVKRLRARWIIAIVVVCFVAILVAPLIVLFGMFAYQDQIVGKLLEDEIRSQPKVVYTKYVPVFEEDNRIYQGSGKPYIVLSDFTARDYRGNPPYSLQMSGKVSNEGGGVAYNGVLHVVALNNEGIVIDDNYTFPGLPAHTVGGTSDFSLHYNSSSPIINCTVTPIYTDAWR
jgi:hypothetical protein